MVIKKLSRDFNMNYTYKLYIPNDGSNKPYSIIEYHKDITFFIWDIYSLKMNIKTKEDVNSFKRTKEWLKENHPEFLI
jgi:hypothetical protein